MTRNSIGFILLLCLSFVSVSAAELTFNYAGKMQSVSMPDRSHLSEAYTGFKFPENADWSSALITKNDSSDSLKSVQTNLLQKLQNLAAQWHDNPALVKSVQQIMMLVTTTPVALRIQAKLDPDWVLLRQEFNPQLEGNYTLYLASYTFKLQLAGLAGNQTLPIHEGYLLADYLADVSYQEGADKDFVYLITPEGQWHKMPVALWNRVYSEPSSGSMIFVGFESSLLPDNMPDLNEQIASYLANRIPQ